MELKLISIDDGNERKLREAESTVSEQEACGATKQRGEMSELRQSNNLINKAN